MMEEENGFQIGCSTTMDVQIVHELALTNSPTLLAKSPLAFEINCTNNENKNEIVLEEHTSGQDNQQQINMNLSSNKESESILIDNSASKNVNLVVSAAPTSYWQSKLSSYVEELFRLLQKGIDLGEYTIERPSQDWIISRLEKARLERPSNETLDESSVTEFIKKLIKDIGIWVVEGKNGVEFDLIRLSSLLKQTAESILSSEQDILNTCGKYIQNIDFYRDLVVENAEKKNYGYKPTKDIYSHLKKSSIGSSDFVFGLHEIWEVREIQSLASNGRLDEVDLTRKRRRFHSALIKSLDKLIKAIDKGKGEDEAFSSYSKLISNPPKIKVQAKAQKVSSNGQSVTLGVDLELTNEQKDECFKRVKSESLTGIGGEEIQAENLNQKGESITKKKRKGVQKKTISNFDGSAEKIVEENTNNENIQTNNIMTPCESGKKASKQSQKKGIIIPESQKANSLNQPNNINNNPLAAAHNSQKNIFSFFKKTGQAVIKKEDPDAPGILVEEKNQETECFNLPRKYSNTISCTNAESRKSLLRKIGASDPRPAHLNASHLIADISSLDDVFSTIVSASKDQWKILAETRRKKLLSSVVASKQTNIKMDTNLKSIEPPLARRRKILVTIHDYIRQYKMTWFDGKSSVVSGQNFLRRDDEVIQYDLDTEDELQEMNAENIENDVDEEDDEEEEAGLDCEDESGKQFIVPDGYLSDEGFEDSDNYEKEGEVFDQRKLNFLQYNFTENSQKVGYIFQHTDTSIDAQAFLQGYRIKRFIETEDADTYPLLIQKKQLDGLESNGSSGGNGREVWTPERIKCFIRQIHGSYLPKKQLIEEFGRLEQMKNISKNRIEKKFKEVVQKFNKTQGELTKRWFIHSAVLESLEFDENEINQLIKTRQEEYLNSRPKKEEKQVTQTAGIISQNTSTTTNITQIGGYNTTISQFFNKICTPAQNIIGKEILKQERPIEIIPESENDIEKIEEEIEIPEQKQIQVMVEPHEQKSQTLLNEQKENIIKSEKGIENRNCIEKKQEQIGKIQSASRKNSQKIQEVQISLNKGKQPLMRQQTLSFGPRKI